MAELIGMIWKALAKGLPAPLRLRLVACTGFVLSIVGYLLWLGYVPAVFPGFARADALRSMQESIAEDSILQLQIERCKLPSGSAKTQYSMTIAKRQLAYQRLTGGETVPLPSCGDL